MKLAFDQTTANAIMVAVAGWIGAIGAFIWRKTRRMEVNLNEVRQALLGFGEQGGALSEIKALRHQSRELAETMLTLNITVGHLTAQLTELRFGAKRGEWEGEERRRKGGHDG